MRHHAIVLFVAALLTIGGCSKKKEAPPAAPPKADDSAGQTKEATPPEAKTNADSAKIETKAQKAQPKQPAAEPTAHAPAGTAAPTDAAATQPKADKPAANAGAAPKVEPPMAAPASGTKPGIAWFGMKNVGLIKLDDAKFTTVVKGLTSVSDIARGPDGTLWVASIGAVTRVKNGKADKVGDFDKPGSVDHIAAGPDGKVWATSFQGVSVYDGHDWTTEDKAKLGKDVELLSDIAVDAKGRVWVASANALHVREGGAWRTLDTSGASRRKLFFKALAIGPSGAMYATHSSGVLKIEGDKITAVKLGRGFFTIVGLAVSPGDTLHIALYDSILVIPPTGTPRKYSGKQGSFAGKLVRAIAADARGRTWAVTDNGMVIIDPNGKVTQWLPGTIRELTDSVQSLLVTAGGPRLPAPGKQVKGSVKGKILKGDEPLANAVVEICSSPSSLFHKSPCEESPFSLRTKTGADGTFLFHGVPLGMYGFAVEQGKKWGVTLSGCCSDMKEGKTSDAGTIKLRE